MFGTYRTFLAVMVVLLHLGGLDALGGYAVFGFYALSGYLMTLIMQRNYGYSRAGRARYALNRGLRIFPLYWLSIAVSAGLVLLVGQGATVAYHSSLHLPGDLPALLRNLLIFFPDREPPLLTPPAWALTVELFYYLLIGLGISRTRRRALLWLGLSVLYHLVANLRGGDWEDIYFAIPAASLPFATGSVIFLYRDALRERLARLQSPYAPYLIAALIIFNWLAGSEFGGLRSGHFYIDYLLNAAMIAALWSRHSLPGISRQADKWWGDLSYPVYLIHYQVGFLVVLAAPVVSVNLQRPDMLLALLSLPLIVAVAYAMIRTIDRPIETLRDRVKRHNENIDRPGAQAERATPGAASPPPKSA